MNAVALRETIFSRYSTNLRLVQRKFHDLKIGFKSDDGQVTFVDQEDVYACPLCLRGFLKDNLSNKNDRYSLTLEHIPPRSLGGKPLILTCKECNNKYGYRLDPLLLDYYNTTDFLKFKKGASIKNVRFSVDGSNPVKSNVTILTDDPHEIFINVKGEGFKYIKNFISEKHKIDKEHSLNLQFGMPIPRNISLALLRIGYLFFFRFFGSAIFLSKNILKIFIQINEPEKEILPKHLGVIHLGPDQSLDEGIYLLSRPSQYRAYFTVFDLKLNGTIRKYLVFIPGPDEKAWEFYQNIEDIGNENEFEIHKLSEVDYITNPKKINGYFGIWKYFEKNERLEKI